MGQYVRGVFAGIMGYGLAAIVDHSCRKLCQAKLTPTPSKKTQEAVIEELIYSIFLQPDKTLPPHWDSYILTVVRAVSAFGTGATAARAICHLTGRDLTPGGGLSLDSKVGLLWVVCREGMLRLLPARRATYSLNVADSLVFGLAELCPPNGEKLETSKNMIVHKMCTAVAFRLIARFGIQYGNRGSPFIQHILFNYLIFRESKWQSRS